MGIRYSFTTARPKSIISKLSKIWVFYTILSVAIIYIGGSYLKIETSIFQSNIHIIEDNMDTQDAKISVINTNTEQLKHEINIDKINKNYNYELQNALNKLFDLIPDQITITQILLEENKLILKGITPTREIYSFLLQAPLKSIFTTSRVDFFPLPNGWFNFTSISVIEKEVQ